MSTVKKSFSWTRIRKSCLTITDQILSVGGMFLVNVVLARTQSKYEYGVFALCYSAFTFLSGIHNAFILETFTVYGSGRYQKHLQPYTHLLWRTNILLGFGLTGLLAVVWRVLLSNSAAVAARTILGMTLSCGVLISAAFVRRTFYVRRRPDLAARFSLVFFLVCAALLWFTARAGILSGFYAFVITAAAWCVAGLSVARELPGKVVTGRFTKIEPGYWAHHWKYSRWVLLTAFVFQLTTQGYYWLAAGILSVNDVGNLRSMSNVVTPIDQLIAAMDLLVLPVMCANHASENTEGLLRIWKAYSATWFVVTCVFAMFVNLLGKPVMHVLYGGKFDDIAPLVGTLAFLPVVMSIGHTVNTALKAAEKPNVVFYAYAFSGSTTFLLGIPLITHLGLLGAVYGMLLSAATYTVALLIGLYFLLSRQRSEFRKPAMEVSGKLQL